LGTPFSTFLDYASFFIQMIILHLQHHLKLALVSRANQESGLGFMSTVDNTSTQTRFTLLMPSFALQSLFVLQKRMLLACSLLLMRLHHHLIKIS
jgi:hypothetical protein